MSKTITLRVGICGCTNRYDGKFHGQSVEVNGRKFVIQEVPIPEASKMQTIASRKTHFFLDLHWFNGLKGRVAWTIFSRVEIIPNGKGKPQRVYFGGMGFRQRFQHRRWWESKRPAQVSKIIKAITKILGVIPPEKMDSWLQRLHT